MTIADPSPVWQIAQRDYKFGKGKHSSLTKATYDAVANKFRGLWGQEAGWAHSVLFAADLRTFSERLTAKLEPDIVIKEEENVEGEVVATAAVKTAVTETKVKRALEDEHQKLEVTTTTKRRRTTRNSLGAF
ncbi:MAG: hypothetical protein INR71_04645 [Terriglobus roseus]|nr:hypothetical protein [Terriglobus roseus]